MKKSIILCVDDEKFVLDSLKSELKNALNNEFIIETAENGAEALDIFKELSKDNCEIKLIISDYVMPGMKGDELIINIHKLNNETLKIMLTGQATMEGVTNVINNAKLYRYIGKPWENNDLVLTVKEALKSYEQDKMLEKQNEELRQLNQSLEIKVEERTAELKIKNKEITDSITYALRIQKAILPHRRDILKAFPQSFVLYKPKDIVAGDFYWFYKNHETVLIAAADCTGHGVPGAFTSMICAEKLNDAVKYSNDSGEILSLVNKGIKLSFKHTEKSSSVLTQVQDGMDIALCSIDIKNGIVKYAGAYRPLWIIRKNNKEVEEIKATKTAIGGDTPNEQIYETHTIPLQQGDTIYLSSDGYADQDGGPDRKKIMKKKFKQILIDIQEKSMKEQKEYLENFIKTWQGDRQQLDDILVIGVKI